MLIVPHPKTMAATTGQGGDLLSPFRAEAFSLSSLAPGHVFRETRAQRMKAPVAEPDGFGVDRREPRPKTRPLNSTRALAHACSDHKSINK